MKPVLKFYGSIEGGKFKPDNAEALIVHTKSLEGEKVFVTMTKNRPYKQRSNPANSYFHGVVCEMIAEYTGYTPEEVKAILKWIFKIKHTSDLSDSEFSEFMSNCRSWAAKELSLYIPEPNEVPFVIPE